MSSARANQLVEAGLWLRLSGDHPGARRLFEQALKLDPGNARAKQLLDSGPGAEPAAPPAAQKPAEPLPEAPAPHSNPFARQDPVGGPPTSMESDWGQAAMQVDAPVPGAPAAAQSLAPFMTSSSDEQPIEVPAKEFSPGATSAWDSKSNPGVHIDNVHPGMGAAMDLVVAGVAPAAKSPREDLREEVHTLLRGAEDLLDLDDHTGAMDLIQKALELAPNDPEVMKLRDNSERTLETMLESKLGKLDAIPRVKLKDDEIIWLNLDHRAGFVLAQIDGTVTFEDLFAVSGMSRLDTARILAQLVEEGVIAMPS
jgi:tetratricopeptide (TPR) repeat protein